MRVKYEYGIIGTGGVGITVDTLNTIPEQVIVTSPPFEPEPFIIKTQPKFECYVGDFKTGKERRRDRRAKERAERKQKFRLKKIGKWN